MSKYHSKRTMTSDGIVHDSMKEAQRWDELRLLERAGKIRELRRQVNFTLIPAQYESYPRYSKKGRRIKDGQTCIEKACHYRADFVYIDCSNDEVVVEDCKGYKTPDYLIKRKLMLQVHGVKIKET